MFIDIQKAFDSVSRNQIWKSLQQRGVWQRHLMQFDVRFMKPVTPFIDNIELITLSFINKNCKYLYINKGIDEQHIRYRVLFKKM